MTIQQEFDRFLAAVYPGTTVAGEQYRALRFAFFGGCLIGQRGDRTHTQELMRWRDAVAREAGAPTRYGENA